MQFFVAQHSWQKSSCKSLPKELEKAARYDHDISRLNMTKSRGQVSFFFFCVILLIRHFADELRRVFPDPKLQATIVDEQICGKSLPADTRWYQHHGRVGKCPPFWGILETYLLDIYI